MNKVKPFIWVEIVGSKKSAGISSKIRDKRNFFCVAPKGKVIKLQINTTNLSKVMTFFIWGRDDSSPHRPDRLNETNFDSVFQASKAKHEGEFIIWVYVFVEKGKQRRNG